MCYLSPLQRGHSNRPRPQLVRGPVVCLMGSMTRRGVFHSCSYLGLCDSISLRFLQHGQMFLICCRDAAFVPRQAAGIFSSGLSSFKIQMSPTVPVFVLFYPKILSLLTRQSNTAATHIQGAGNRIFGCSFFLLMIPN